MRRFSLSARSSASLRMRSFSSSAALSRARRCSSSAVRSAPPCASRSASSSWRTAFSARRRSTYAFCSSARRAFAASLAALASACLLSSSALRSARSCSRAIRRSALRSAFSAARRLASSASSLVICDICRRTHCLLRSSVSRRASLNCWCAPSALSTVTMLKRTFLPNALPIRFRLRAKITGTSASRATSMRSSTVSSRPPSAVEISRLGAKMRHLALFRATARADSRSPTQ
mmetsp:Transcript_44393/g.139191  ORF Transcript_44393/g.139191 Transcript_44393/m.139191 type:complete len:233 (+) Transcript_44393:217-915(+)